MDSRLLNSPYLRACRGEATAHTPVWLNRQAGRYMPEYHALKEKLRPWLSLRTRKWRPKPPWMRSASRR